VNELDPKEIS